MDTVTPSESYAAPKRPIIALDNTGTISDSTVVSVDTLTEKEVDEPLTERSSADGECCLVTLNHQLLSSLETTDSLGTVVGADVSDYYISLTNADVRRSDIQKILAETDVTARRITQCAHRVWQKHTNTSRRPAFSASTLPVSAQLVIDTDIGAIVQIKGHAATPTSDGDSIAHELMADGHEIHIVSGDAMPVLENVREELCLSSLQLHAYQSAASKAETVRQLSENSRRPVIMIGDYINDRLAFNAADYAIFVNNDPTPFTSCLSKHANKTVSSITEVPQACVRWADGRTENG